MAEETKTKVYSISIQTRTGHFEIDECPFCFCLAHRLPKHVAATHPGSSIDGVTYDKADQNG